MYHPLRRARTLVAVLAVLLLVPVTAGSAVAGTTSHPAVVSANPSDVTPNVVDDATVPNAVVLALAEAGGTVVAGGTFRTVQDAARTRTYARTNVMAFSATTGVLTGFAPTVNGSVWGLAVSGPSVYVAGSFTTVNGVARRGIAKVDLVTGAVDPRFDARFPSGRVTEVRVVGGRLIVGGTFAKRLAALDPATGADTGYLDLGIAGSVATNAGSTDVYRFSVNAAGTRLVAVGNFTSVSGQARRRAFMVTLGATTSRLHPWYYQPLDRSCAATSLPAYLRDVDFAPDGSYFVLVSTGYVPRTTAEIGTSVCDAAARFETGVSAPTRPTWINYTGGDTLHSVVATGATVYVQGHQRWLDNPLGRNNPGPGAVSRPGIGAIDPATGTALAWNPTKSREVGGKDMLATSSGLWVGSDGNTFARESRAGIAFLPR